MILPVLVVAWGMATYITFWTADGRQQLGVLGWLGMTVIVFLVAAMMWLMTGRLPAYIIEVEDEPPTSPRGRAA
jgi:hypothetical protein